MGLTRADDRRGPAAHPRPRERAHRREAAAAAEHRQLPQAGEHLRRLHAACARSRGDGAAAPRRRPRCSHSPTGRESTSSPHRRHRDRGRARDDRAGLDRPRRRGHESDHRDRPLQHAGDLPVRRAAAGARGQGARARPHDGALAAVEAGRAHGRPRRDPQHRPVLDPLRRHRGHGRRPRGGLSRAARSRGSRTSRAGQPAPTSATS